MAETNDLMAHYRSINPESNSITMLNGKRFGDRYQFQANQQYQIPADTWQALKPMSADFIEMIQWYVNDHYINQLPRILELERYYQADNNIHYWMSNKRRGKADKRITSGLPRYITNIRVGYEFGNPLTFGYSNQDDENDTGDNVLNALADFNRINDEPYHEKVMGKNLCNTGRAYELIYCAKGENAPQITPIDPNQAFVVWSTDVKPMELFAVRYYAVNVMDQVNYQIEIYTSDYIYYYQAGDNPASDWKLVLKVEHSFGDVPLIEYALNDEHVGVWEPKLDEIDEYDQSLSEMANSQADFSNAMLLINGEVQNNTGKLEQMIGPNGKPLYIDNLKGGYTSNPQDSAGKTNQVVMVQKVLDTHANVLYLRPYVYDQPNGSKMVSQTTAQYLTKQLSAQDWSTYINQLLADIHKDTNTPDTTDANFAANASGVAMSYKLWGVDQERDIMQSLYQRSLMQRLKLICQQWSFVEGVDVQADQYSNVTIAFTPNLPKNDSEIMQNISAVKSTGAVSDETIQEMAEQVTGIPADQEQQRMSDQKDANMQRGQDAFGQLPGMGSDDNEVTDDGDDNETAGTESDQTTSEAGSTGRQSTS
ncbi:SPP1 family phage portal protein [Lactobacillus buchneri CD034] [Lactiplantibacillus mudanjiangensis]|uniref:phage portal protein n=1 Tax=Lactiplantibacillus mudanjiangensis TaxID=1296538 RepID=UPI001015B3BF|nr:phage portal protein [Lactiplantibacillus mudanjiangensis]VDG31400.1 SPP1 family phage portal protein [Lactobacillus buchneri CD034] [Lactiplantibacillus mudanjiangensis]